MPDFDFDVNRYVGSRYHVTMRLFVLLIPAVLLAQQPDPAELLKESAAAIKQYKSYQIDSTVTVEMHGGPIKEKLEMPSSISVKRPGKMRVESRGIGGNGGSVTIVSDGEHTWFYVSAAKKYVKRDAVEAPEAAVINNGGLPANLPDLNQSIKSMKLKGEDVIDIGGVKTSCWVIETMFDRITVPDENVSVRDAVQLTWVSKDKHLTLRSTFGATVNLPGVAEPVQMTQSTHTTKVRLDVTLPDSLFVFTPPPGTKETDDWTLPGIAKPDVIGKPAPAALLTNHTGAVVLAYFATSPCVPCDRDRAVVEKLRTEFGGYLSVVTPAEDYPELSLTSFPTTVLIDRDGKIASYEAGARGEAALRADLKKLGIGASK
jgi:outer membrane lipoprotein-sorting protein